MPPSRTDRCPELPRSDLPHLEGGRRSRGVTQGREITNRVLEDIGATEDQVALTYDNRPKSVLIDRLEWARSYAKLGGVLDSPQRGLYVLSTLGRDTLAMPQDKGIESS